MMFKKLSLIFFLVILFTSCGFQPIYKVKNTNFYIDEITIISGNRELNNNIKKNLQKFKSDNKDSKIKVSIESDYVKNTLIKDKTGKTVEYEIKANVTLTYEINGLEKKIYLTEKTQINQLNNSFDQDSYERNIIYNLSNTFVEKFIIELVNAN